MIELKNITYKVVADNQERTILDDVSCKFLDNELVAITGPNGSGKSTLTKIIMGIIKPTSGQVFFNGKNITKLSVTERAKLGISYAFQQPITFIGITVKQLIDLATEKTNSVAEICDYLSRVGICAKDYVYRDFNKSLSGGEQKRIELALALARNSACAIFDEPEAGIDMWSFEKLLKLFDKNKLNVVVSHNEKLLQVADKIMVLNEGKIVEFDSSKKVLKNLNKKTCSRLGG